MKRSIPLILTLVVIVGAVACTSTVVVQPPTPTAPPPTANAPAPAPSESSAPPPVLATPSGPFNIRFHRPDQVGQTIRIKRATRDRQTKNTRMGQQVVKQDIVHREVEFEADYTPLALDGTGNQIRAQYVVHRCVATVNQSSRPLVTPGATVVVQRADPPIVTVNGQPMSADDVELLDLVISTDPPRPMPDDAIFGTPTPQPVGATWPINAQNAAADLRESGMIIDPSNLQGQVRLANVRPCSAGHCLAVVAEMQATGIQMPELPNGAVVTSGVLNTHMEGFLPVNPSHPSVQGGLMQMRANIEIAVPNGPPNLNIQLIMEREQAELPQGQ